MQLISGIPDDGVEAFQSPSYLCAKRLISVLEGSGTISLHVLQGALLVAWYEYGHAIYPAAWMTAGWCVRYGDLLGINGNTASAELLGRPVSEQVIPLIFVYATYYFCTF